MKVQVDLHAVKLLVIAQKIRSFSRESPDGQRQRNILGREFSREMRAAGLPRLHKRGARVNW
jgi:hypothetical protein